MPDAASLTPGVSGWSVEKIASRLRELNEERIATAKREAEVKAIAAIQRAEDVERTAVKRAVEARRAAEVRRVTDYERIEQALMPEASHIPHRLSEWSVEDIASRLRELNAERIAMAERAMEEKRAAVAKRVAEAKQAQKANNAAEAIRAAGVKRVADRSLVQASEASPVACDRADRSEERISEWTVDEIVSKLREINDARVQETRREAMTAAWTRASQIERDAIAKRVKEATQAVDAKRMGLRATAPTFVPARCLALRASAPPFMPVKSETPRSTVTRSESATPPVMPTQQEEVFTAHVARRSKPEDPNEPEARRQPDIKPVGHPRTIRSSTNSMNAAQTIVDATSVERTRDNQEPEEHDPARRPHKDKLPLGQPRTSRSTSEVTIDATPVERTRDNQEPAEHEPARRPQKDKLPIPQPRTSRSTSEVTIDATPVERTRDNQEPAEHDPARRPQKDKLPIHLERTRDNQEPEEHEPARRPHKDKLPIRQPRTSRSTSEVTIDATSEKRLPENQKPGQHEPCLRPRKEEKTARRPRVTRATSQVIMDDTSVGQHARQSAALLFLVVLSAFLASVITNMANITPFVPGVVGFAKQGTSATCPPSPTILRSAAFPPPVPNARVPQRMLWDPGGLQLGRSACDNARQESQSTGSYASLHFHLHFTST